MGTYRSQLMLYEVNRCGHMLLPALLLLRTAVWCSGARITCVQVGIYHGIHRRRHKKPRSFTAAANRNPPRPQSTTTATGAERTHPAKEN